MDPYTVLGVQRTQSLEEIEARFRALLRETHPDLHHQHGPGQEEEAQRRTRLLTEAMGSIRSDYATAGAAVGTFGGTSASGGATSGAWVDRASSSPAERSRNPVACPHCGEEFVELSQFEGHLASAHPASAKTAKRAPRKPRVKRERRGARRAERALETSALAITVVGMVLLGVFQQPLTDQFGLWVRPMTVVMMSLGLVMVGVLLLQRRR